MVVETQGGDQYTTKDIEQMLRDLHLLQQVSCYMAMLRQNRVHGLDLGSVNLPCGARFGKYVSLICCEAAVIVKTLQVFRPMLGTY